MTRPDFGAQKFPSLSVFFPAYNDALSLPSLVETAFAVLERCVEEYEVIVINDGSQDNTGEVLAALQEQHEPRLRVVTHNVNRGYGGALRSGFEAAKFDYVFYTDGDGQYDVRELPLLLDAAAPRVGLVNGYKLRRSDPWHRILIGRAYNLTARGLFRIHIRDIDCDFRLIRGELLADIGLRSTSGTVCVELVRKLELTGCGVVEVGVSHYPRLHGRSQFFRVRSLLSTFTQLLSLYFQLAITGSASRDVASLRRVRRMFPQAE
jgi:glycosyltransferase involved in cell wall biosynthesis